MRAVRHYEATPARERLRNLLARFGGGLSDGRSRKATASFTLPSKIAELAQENSAPFLPSVGKKRGEGVGERHGSNRTKRTRPPRNFPSFGSRDAITGTGQSVWPDASQKVGGT